MDNHYEPFYVANELVGDHEKLSESLEERGHLFFKGLLDRDAIDRCRADIRSLLLANGFVVDDPDCDVMWSGKYPEGEELQPLGRLGRRISELDSLAAVYRDKGLLSALHDLFGGEVFSWVENPDRVRVVFQAGQSGDTGGGQKFSYATPGHQDGYHFPVPFVTAWTPLMDMDVSAGGLALRAGSHKEGLHRHWWKGAEYLGVAENPRQASEFAALGGTAVAGDVAPSDGEKTWLRSDYKTGDVLIFHPWMIHRGLPNVSSRLRISADFRFQRADEPTVWQAKTRLHDCHDYLNRTRACLGKMGLDSVVADNVWEMTRRRGPSADIAVEEQVAALVAEYQRGN
jgi:hypothetical protein